MAGAVWLCNCRCHSSLRGSYEGARQIGDWHGAMLTSSDPLINANVPVDCSDPLEAAVACDLCKHYHVRALSDMPDFLPPRDWMPGQADGDADE